MTSWLYFYIAASLGLVVYLTRRYKNLRPVLHSVKLDGLETYLDASTLLVDVRSEKEWERDAWEQATHIPYDQISMIGVELQTKILLICNSGIRSSHAATTLVKKGFTQVSFFEGYHKDIISYIEAHPELLKAD